MKKGYLFLSFSIACLGMQAQSVIENKTIEMKTVSPVYQKVKVGAPKQQANQRITASMIYDYGQGLTDYDQGGTQNPISSTAVLMFPDTTINIATKDQAGNDTLWQFPNYTSDVNNGAGFYSFNVGQVLDPRSTVFSLSANNDYYQLSKYNPYTIDSVSIQYFYIRSTASTIVDTLNVQWIPNGSFAKKASIGYTGGPQPEYVPSAAPAYDPASNSALGAALTVTIPLTEADTASSGEAYKTVVINKVMNAKPSTNGVSAVTFSYSPGNAYSKTVPFDTLGTATFGGNPVANPLNAFYYVFNYDQTKHFEDNTGVKPADQVFNNGVFTTVANRYDLVPNTAYLYHTYYPGGLIYTRSQGTERVPVFPRMLWYITSDNIGMDDLKANVFQMGDAYPNPSNGVVRVPFQLAKTEKVTINVYNLVGELVRTITNENYGAGVHGVDINVDQLAAGIYTCTMTAAGASKSQRITVVK
jgi:hypothetical protein